MVQLTFAHLTVRHRHPVPLVFTLGGGEDGLHARRQAALIITGLETRGNLLVQNPFAKRIRQYAFQSVTDLQKHLVVLHKRNSTAPLFLSFSPTCHCRATRTV